MTYWKLSRAPRHSILFAFPLLLLYEGLAMALGGDSVTGVRNGADVLLKSLFLSIGGSRGLLAFDLLLLGVGAWLIWRDRASGPVQPRLFAGMLAESAGLAVVFGAVAGLLTALLLRAPTLAVGGLGQFGLATQVMLSLGAGIYEELLFRVLLVSGLLALGKKVFGWGPTGAGVFAVVLGALIFSAFHYVGAYGDDWQLRSFVYRTVAGLLFSGLFVLRGFGITAWTHALYDVFLAVAGVG